MGSVRKTISYINMRTGFLFLCIFFVCSSPACEGKSSLKFLQSLAKKVHTKKNELPMIPLPQLPAQNVSSCNVKENRLNDQFKKAMQDAHNRKRITVASGQESGQPSASNMNALRWDDDASSYATWWAGTCPSGHSPKPRPHGYGENIATYIGIAYEDIGQKWLDAVDYWYSEVAQFDPGNIDPFVYDYDAGHYTQVVWATTTKVGCGYAFYTNDNGANEMKIVCSYSPGGNMVGPGSSMYHEGDACSECD